MRYMIGSQMDLVAAPIIFLVGVAYVWVADRLLSRKAGARTVEQAPTVPGVSKAA